MSHNVVPVRPDQRVQGRSPGLRSVAVQDLVGSDQVQLPMALLKHVDPRQPAGGGDQSLLHGGWVHQLPVQDGAAGQSKGGEPLLSLYSAGAKFLRRSDTKAAGKTEGRGHDFMHVCFLFV